jgi:SpoVK/Ycf46/Vps4 family AAA+-type ATPase
VVAEDKDRDSWIVKCPKCGKIFDSCEHVSKEDIQRILHLLKQGVEVYESDGELEESLEGFPPADEPQRPRLYELVEPRYALDDVVLSPRTRDAIEDALVELRHKVLIFKRWGFQNVVRKKDGLSLLFAGPPGTGKTMTAEAIAHELGRPLMIVNYAELENMWVGETEKNIEAVFKEAEGRNAVLFFDEADAVFHRRGYAAAPWTNRDVNVLLRHLEQFPGVVILASNMPGALDRALDRRVDIGVDFEMPNAEMRRRIYETLVPPNAPLAKNVNFAALARRYPLSGGSILNVVRQAMRHALRRGRRRRITQDDFVRAAEKEMAKGTLLRRDHLAEVDRRERIGGYI